MIAILFSLNVCLFFQYGTEAMEWLVATNRVKDHAEAKAVCQLFVAGNIIRGVKGNEDFEDKKILYRSCSNQELCEMWFVFLLHTLMRNRTHPCHVEQAM